MKRQAGSIFIMEEIKSLERGSMSTSSSETGCVLICCNISSTFCSGWYGCFPVSLFHSSQREVERERLRESVCVWEGGRGRTHTYRVQARFAKKAIEQQSRRRQGGKRGREMQGCLGSVLRLRLQSEDDHAQGPHVTEW